MKTKSTDQSEGSPRCREWEPDNIIEHCVHGSQRGTGLRFSTGLRSEGILNNLEFVPGFLTNYEQQGFCPRCGVLGRLLILNMARLGDNGVVSKTRCFSMISSSITRRWSLPPLESHKMEILPSLAKPVQLPWFLNQITGSHMWRKVTFGGVLTRCWTLRFSRILSTTRAMN